MGQLESRGVIRKKSKCVLSKNGIAKVKAREQEIALPLFVKVKEASELNRTEGGR